LRNYSANQSFCHLQSLLFLQSFYIKRRSTLAADLALAFRQTAEANHLEQRVRITDATFVRSVADVKRLPRDGLPQIAFSGRSNVGKSSLINALLNRRKLAQTSSTPGKTRLLNFYLINKAFYFVDLPGYGFAKVSQAERAQWRDLIEGYLKNNSALAGIVALIDCRIGATDLDVQLVEWLAELKMPAVIVATKADKLSQQQQIVQRRTIEDRLAHLSIHEILLFSANTGLGKTELWACIDRFLKK
jgi:GTP-binding protein